MQKMQKFSEIIPIFSQINKNAGGMLGLLIHLTVWFPISGSRWTHISKISESPTFKYHCTVKLLVLDAFSLKQHHIDFLVFLKNMLKKDVEFSLNT